MLRKYSLISDGQQFLGDRRQDEQSHLTLTRWTKRKTILYDVGNGSWFGTDTNIW